MIPRPATPGIGRRLLSLIYELLLLTALVLLVGAGATAISQSTAPDHARIITQILVALFSVGYFAGQWHHRGQTLPMKTWRMRLETTDGKAVTIPRAVLRACLAPATYLFFGMAVLWALIDRDRQFLHDRIAGTRLVIVGQPGGTAGFTAAPAMPASPQQHTGKSALA